MESFVFDYYGYNIDKIKDGYFDYQGYRFTMISTTENEQNIAKLDEITPSLKSAFNNDIVYFVKNRYNQYISINESTNIILLTYKIGEVTLDHIINMHNHYFNYNQKALNILEILSLWEQRVDYLENQCLVTLNFDNPQHKDLYEHAMFSIGIAENAIQYLSDIKIDFPKATFTSTLTHRRLKFLNKWELFNPFNLIFDHTSRDLSELYKNDIIDLPTLFKLTTYYKYQIHEYQYLLARILFPTAIFDTLEDIYLDKSYDHTKAIYDSIALQNHHINKAKDFYLKLQESMSFRPIRWLSQI